ncbi:glycosyltransferase [Micromonosporaceae bacterium Da 78-11]
MTRYAVLAHGTRGDVDPFVALARLLRQRGHDVTVHTHAPYEKAVRRTGAQFRAVDDAAAYQEHLRRTRALIADRSDGGATGYYADPALFWDRVSIAGGLDQIRAEVDALVDGGGRPVLVGRLHSALSAVIAAELTGAPLCQVSLTPFQLMTAPVTALHLARSAGARLNDLRGSYGLAPVTRWSPWLTRADLRAGLWPRWFDRAGPAAAEEVLLTGFPLADQDSGPVAAPARVRDDVVLVTGGTGRMLHDEFYPAAVAGLAASGRRGIVVTPHRDLLPDRLPAGVEHRMSLPFDRVMPSVAGVVHHGGVGTLARALAAGIPQLLLADGGDRPDNGGRLARLGLARSLGPADWTAATIGAAITALGPTRSAPAPGPDALTVLADRLATLS